MQATARMASVVSSTLPARRRLIRTFAQLNSLLAMCRYAFKDYKPHFACFDCRKTFKKVAMKDYFAQRGLAEAYDRLFHTSLSSKPYRDYVARYGTDCDAMSADYLATVGVCPQCSAQMAPMGLDFRAPPRDDCESWTIIQSLYEHGFSFTGCGCSVGYSPPTKLSGMSDFLQRHSKRSEGALLLESITRRLST